MNKSLDLLNKTTCGIWWLLLFLFTLVLSFITASQGVAHVFKQNQLVWIVGGVFGIVFTIIGALLIALLLWIVGWFSHATVNYTSYVRIASVDALIRLLVAFIPHNPLQTLLSEGLSATYLSLAIFVAIPIEKRQYRMLLIGWMPTIILILWNVSQWIITRS